MKAISLWQPWASAVVIGSKKIETRSWATNHRGPLLIHAAKRKVLGELIHLNSCWNWCGALSHLGVSMGGGKMWELLPFGAIIGYCRLVDCKPTGSFTGFNLDYRNIPKGENKESFYAWTERQMGDFSLGRYGWVLEDFEMFKKPIPYAGHQGFFNVPDRYLEIGRGLK